MTQIGWALGERVPMSVMAKAKRRLITVAGGILLSTAAIVIAADTFIIGGAVYSDLENPLATGVPGVTVTVTGAGAECSAVTQPFTGLWVIQDVPGGPYHVEPAYADTDWIFRRVLQRNVLDHPYADIEVNQANQARNQSIQFLAIHPGDLDCDGDVDLDDHALLTDCWAGAGPDQTIAHPCNLADFDRDQDLDLADWAGFQQVFQAY